MSTASRQKHTFPAKSHTNVIQITVNPHYNTKLQELKRKKVVFISTENDLCDSLSICKYHMLKSTSYLQ
jgi:hypothetical protein